MVLLIAQRLRLGNSLIGICLLLLIIRGLLRVDVRLGPLFSEMDCRRLCLLREPLSILKHHSEDENARDDELASSLYQSLGKSDSQTVIFFGRHEYNIKAEDLN